MSAHERLHFVRVLGYGATGSVYEVQTSLYPGRYALKCISYRKDRTLRLLALQEAELHASLSHSSILSFFKCSEGDKEVQLLTELCTYGSLYSYLSNPALQGSDIKDLFCAQLCSAVHYLHEEAMESSSVIHRDIKLENVLVSSPRQVKLADFGAAIVKKKYAVGRWGRAGTPGYMSPEMLRKDSYGSSTDLWSLGLLLAEIWSASLWSYGSIVKDVLPAIIVERMNLLSTDRRQIVSRFLQVNMYCRYTAGWSLNLPILVRTLEQDHKKHRSSSTSDPPDYKSRVTCSEIGEKSYFTTAQTEQKCSFGRMHPFKFEKPTP